VKAVKAIRGFDGDGNGGAELSGAVATLSGVDRSCGETRVSASQPPLLHGTYLDLRRS
jgi:hypothetical protein